MRKPLTWLIGLSAIGGSLAVAAPVAGAAGHNLTATHARAVGVANRAEQLPAAAPTETMSIWRLPPPLPTRLPAVDRRAMDVSAAVWANAATPDLQWNPIIPSAFTRRSASVIGVSGRVVSAVYYNLPLYVAADWNRLAGLLEEVPVNLPPYVAADWNRLAGLLKG